MERTITLNGATIKARSATIRDAIRRDKITSALFEQFPDLRIEAILFATEVSQSVMDGEIDGWTLPAADALDAELIAAFERWLALPGNVYRQWQTAIAEVDGLTDEPDEEKKVNG